MLLLGVWAGLSGTPDARNNLIFLNLMFADLIQALGLWAPGIFFMQNPDVGSLSSRRTDRHQVDG